MTQSQCRLYLLRQDLDFVVSTSASGSDDSEDDEEPQTPAGPVGRGGRVSSRAESVTPGTNKPPSGMPWPAIPEIASSIEPLLTDDEIAKVSGGLYVSGLLLMLSDHQTLHNGR